MRIEEIKENRVDDGREGGWVVNRWRRAEAEQGDKTSRPTASLFLM
jgi:hypothetical protein